MRLRNKIFLTVIVLVAAIFVASAVFVYPKTRDFVIKIQQANQEFSTAISLVKKSDWPKSADYFQKSSDSFAAAQKICERVGFLNKIPVLGREYIFAKDIVSVGLILGRVAAHLALFSNEALQPLGNSQGNLNEIKPETRKEILKKLYEAPPALSGAKAEINLALLSLKSMPNGFLSLFFQNKISGMKEKLNFLNQTIDDAIPLTELLPILSGYPSPKTFLFLLQNNTELRPTGGFIGTYGILKTRDGQAVDFMTDDVYNLDRQSNPKSRPATPLPLQKYLSQKVWYLRDANWSPDFKESARTAARFYQEEGGKEKKIDGVIAITPEIISSFLKIIGPLALGQQIFTAENLVDALELQVEKNYIGQGIPKSQRKDIISAMAYKLMDSLQKVPLEKWPAIIHEIKQDLDEKQILIYSNDKNSQDFLETINWAGRPTDFAGDYLMAIDANLAALKTDLVMERAFSYDLEKINNELVATAKISYTNQGEGINWRTTRYRTYTRLYVPPGSALISSRGAMVKEKNSAAGEVDVGQEFGKTFFGAFLAVEPGETKILEFKYKLPAALEEKIQKGEYQLLVQKQPGVAERDLTVRLNLGKTILQWQPTGFSVKKDKNSLVWQTKLRRDQIFLLNF